MCQRTSFELLFPTECSKDNLICDSCGEMNAKDTNNNTKTGFEEIFTQKYEEKLLQYGDKVEKMNARNVAKAVQHPPHLPKHHPHQSSAVYRDFLAVGTQYTKLVFIQISDYQKAIASSTGFKILTRTTQPAHVIAVSIVLLVLGVVWPNFFPEQNVVDQPNRSVWTILTYLTTFAMHFGAQVWMTFVSGLALYFSLPRHTFGQCQQVLFPKYFALNSLLSIITLVTFVKVHGSAWELSSYIQVIALTVCATIELTVRLYLAKPLLKLMRVKYEYESKIGSGTEVGHLAEGDLAHCPHYQKIHKAFRKIHMMCAMGNMFAMVCTCVHLHYLASKIQIL